MKVLHLAYCHKLEDTRIFYKECRSLAQAGYEVHYVTGGDEYHKIEENNLVAETITFEEDVSVFKHPFQYRVIRKRNLKKLYDYLLSKEFDVCHIHENRLIEVIGVLKKNRNCKLIYDAHEDSPREMLDYFAHYGKFKYFWGRVLSHCKEIKENHYVKKVDAVITATPEIGKRFSKFHKNVSVVRNYAILEASIVTPRFDSHSICYVGSISPIRGIVNIVKAIEGTDIGFNLAGTIPEDYERELKALKGWENVKTYGYVNKEKVLDIYGTSCIGMLTLLEGKNIENSLPIKLFEYMQSGIPVIASHFPLWKEIIDNAGCGICIDPSDIKGMKHSIEALLKDPKKMKEMGENGRKAVIEQYNWDTQKATLLNVYSQFERKA